MNIVLVYIAIALLIMSAVGYHVVVRPLKRKYGKLEYSRTAQIIRYGTLFLVAGAIITTIASVHYMVYAVVGAIFGNYIWTSNKQAETEHKSK